MKPIVGYGVPVLLTILLSGCVAATGNSQVERDLEEMKRRLEAVEQTTLGKGQADQQELNRKLAEQLAELDALRVEMQKIQGRLDDAAHERKELHDLMSMVRSEQEMRVNSLEERLDSMGASSDPPPAVPAAGAGAGDAKAAYDSAVKIIQQDKDFAAGRKQLSRFIKDYPDHELVVNAMYWVGEAYYGEKKYENAILQFQDIIQKYPKHGKAAAAQLKQALAFQALGDKETTRALLKKVEKNYPGTPEAKKAKEKLKNL